MPVAAIYGTKHYAIQSDHLNTPRRLIQSDGQVAWQWAYSAFGDEKPTVAKNRFANLDLNQSFGTSTVATVTFNLRYPGQYFDQESNLHYNYHRSYSATLGGYIQTDPIGLQGGWNGFAYSNQNPLSFTDPLGLQVAIGGSGAGGVAGGAIGGSSIGGGTKGGYDPRTDTYNPAKRGAGERIIDAIIDFCTPDDTPCSPPEGTKCWDIHTDHSHAGLQPHFQIYQMAKVDKICGWQKRGGKVGKGVFGEQPEGMKNCRSIPGFTPR
jgi:RHS repeat-associated protein